MSHAIVTPFGRDYISEEEALKDWQEGKDFILRDISSRWDGLPFNIGSAKEGGFAQVNIRFDKLQKIIVVDI
jgi:hypothetical protein